jgi:phosphomannomutase
MSIGSETVIVIDSKFLDVRNEKEKVLLDLVESNSPADVRVPILPQNEQCAFEFGLTRDLVESLELWDWLENYRKEAAVSTSGIRGPQNVLYPWDTRFPINQIGISLATIGKSLVALEKNLDKTVCKLAAGEVRYNSKKYVELIARIQAALGIHTYVPRDFNTMPVWMVSFLIFKEDLNGGEHVTSSHAISTKTATKDLNDQGSQYLPEESLEFVKKIEMILRKAESGGYTVRYSAIHDSNVDFDWLEEINYGIDLYVEYLKSGVATDANLNLILREKPNLVIDCVGGCMFRTMRHVFDRLGLGKSFKWLHDEEDPFFYAIGKLDYNPETREKEYFDLSCDLSILDVAKTAHYEQKLKDEPIGTVMEITDPDGDRLVVCEIEPASRRKNLEELGIAYIKMDGEKILGIYTPNQSYLMTMDFHAGQLKKEGIWDDHPRFIIKTAASAMSWDEWAAANDVKCINVPVGFKEIASMMKKVEAQLISNPDGSVIVRDIYGEPIDLGIQPRVLFAGEESGGMITGPEELIRSKAGRQAISMREKSAGEAMIIVSALAAHCMKEGMHLSEYFEDLLEKNRIVGRFDVRWDTLYYNESEPNPVKFKQSKIEGEKKRDKNDLFFLGIALAIREGKIGLEEAKEILSDALPSLNFSDLEDIKFVGDGTYLKFADKFVEIRKSGTDARTRVYTAGSDKEDCAKFAKAFGNYSGEITEIYKRHIDEKFLSDVVGKAWKIYLAFLIEGS